MNEFAKLSFNTTSLGAFLITASFLVKSSLTQMKVVNTTLDILCLITFAFGWIVTSYSLAMDEEGNINLGDSPTLLIFGSSLLIAMSGLVLHKHFKLPIEGDIDMFVKGAFIMGWILLAYVSGLEKDNRNLTMNILGSIVMLVGILVAMPWEQKNNIVGGPSMVAVIMGWVFITFGNSVQFQE